MSPNYVSQFNEITYRIYFRESEIQDMQSSRIPSSYRLCPTQILRLVSCIPHRMIFFSKTKANGLSQSSSTTVSIWECRIDWLAATGPSTSILYSPCNFYNVGRSLCVCVLFCRYAHISAPATATLLSKEYALKKPRLCIRRRGEKEMDLFGGCAQAPVPIRGRN